MRHSVDKTVVLLVATNLTHEEARVENQSDNDGQKSDETEEHQNALAPVQDKPADVERDRRAQADAQYDEEGDGLLAS